MLLEVENVSVGYGGAPAIVGVSLEVGAGEIVSVIGPNGAGKSTLINAIAGLLRAADGMIVLDGADITRIAPYRVCHHGIALVPENRRLFASMTVEENLEIGCYRRAARRHRVQGLERVYALFPMLRERRQQPAGTLSGGQQQMVAVGRALMAEPKLLLLDEPSLGLAPSVVGELFRVLRAIHAEGMAMLLVEQSVAQALDLADRAYVLEEGRIVATGLPDQLRSQTRIREVYLGL
jgi:branched-chain amino acid transport system ATP-binding protein